MEADTFHIRLTAKKMDALKKQNMLFLGIRTNAMLLKLNALVRLFK